MFPTASLRSERRALGARRAGRRANLRLDRAGRAVRRVDRRGRRRRGGRRSGMAALLFAPPAAVVLAQRRRLDDRAVALFRPVRDRARLRLRRVRAGVAVHPPRRWTSRGPRRIAGRPRLALRDLLAAQVQPQHRRDAVLGAGPMDGVERLRGRIAGELGAVRRGGRLRPVGEIRDPSPRRAARRGVPPRARMAQAACRPGAVAGGGDRRRDRRAASDRRRAPRRDHPQMGDPHDAFGRRRAHRLDGAVRSRRGARQSSDGALRLDLPAAASGSRRRSVR